jgi:3-methyladenine DNA glycosylase/8-oxoguanine DNA glycosylase
LSRLRYNRRRAVEHLSAACPALGRFIDGCGPLRLKVSADDGVFGALSRAIVYQQLSGRAAATIYGRFADLFEDGRPVPAGVLHLDFEELRGAGLSRGKALAIRDLAERSLDGSLASRRRLGRLDDAGVIENLCRVRGIGPWTAQMFLIFNLGRPDVMPASDLGVQKGVRAVYGLDALPSPDEVLDRTRHLAPFRSAASWYFWRAAETTLPT